MTWSEPLRLNDVIRVTFYWEDDNGVPLTTLSPVPTLELVEPDGTTTSALALTQNGASQYWYRDVTLDSDGVWKFQARCTDTDVAREYTDAIAVAVGNLGVTSVFDGDAETQIDAIEAKTNLIGTSGAFINVPVQVGDNRLTLVIGDSYLTSQSRNLTFIGLSAPDLTTATAINLFIDNQLTASCTALTASSVSCQLTSTQTSALRPGIVDFDIRATYATPATVTIIVKGKVSILAPTPGA